MQASRMPEITLSLPAALGALLLILIIGAWDDRFRLDVWYVDHRSLLLDLEILLLTVIRVLRRQGITAEGSATMPKFCGPGT